MSSIAFIDLQAQRSRIKEKVDTAINNVLEHGQFILGPEVRDFESKLATFGQAEFTVSCANGSDALMLPLMAWGIGAGDAVFVPSFTFAATAEMPAIINATPVFVDVLPDTFNIDPESLTAAIEGVVRDGRLKPKAIIAVDLFGQIANYPELRAIADAHNLKLISDAAQGFGSTLNGKHSAHWADAVSTSFFPAKPLGCYGDGGAVVTNDATLVDAMRSIRMHGQGVDKYDNVRLGVNSRLDSIQAAVLIEKLAIFADEIEKRNIVAERYSAALSAVAVPPYVPQGVVSTWAQYTIQIDDRAELQRRLSEQGIPSVPYYPKPLHQQTAYRDYPVGAGGLEVTDRLADAVLSLPMHPYLDASTQDSITSAVVDVLSPMKAAG